MMIQSTTYNQRTNKAGLMALRAGSAALAVADAIT